MRMPDDVSIDPNALRSSLPVIGVFGLSIEARDSIPKDARRAATLGALSAESSCADLKANGPNLSCVVDAAACAPLRAVERKN